jgi:PAS domain S-box-containing protein
MIKPYLKKRLYQAGIMLILSAFLLFLFYSLHKLSKIEQNSIAISNDRESLFLTQKIVSHVTHFEIELKGFAISDNDNIAFEENPFNSLLLNDFDKLKRLNNADSIVIENLNKLLIIITRRYKDNAAHIAAIKGKTASTAEASQFVMEGKVFIKEVQAIAKSIETSNYATLQKEEDFDRDNLHYLRTIIYISLIAIAFLVVLIISLYQSHIKQLKQKNQELENLSNIIDQSEDAVIFIDKDFAIKTFSKGAEKISGYTADEAFLNSTLLFNKLHFASQEARDAHKKTLIEKGRITTHVKFMRKDETEVYLFISMTEIKSEQNKTIGYVSFIRDITELRAAEEKMQQLNKIIENTSDAIYTTDKDGRITSWNKGAEKLYGFTEAEVLGIHPLQLLDVQQRLITDPDSFDFTKNFFARQDSIHHKKSGEAMIVDVSLNYLVDNNDGYFLIIASDVTQKKAEEKRILELANRFALTNDPFIMLDKNYTIRGWNKGANTMYGYTETEALGLNIDDLVVAKIAFSNETAELHKATLYWQGEGLHKRKDGTLFPVLLSVTFLKDENNEVTGYLLNVIDITERKQMEERLKNMNSILEYEVAEKTAELRDIFERITDGFVALDNSYQLTYANKIVAGLLDKDLKELVGKNILEVLPDLDKNLVRAYEKAMQEQKAIQLEDFFPKFNAWLFVSLYPSPKGVSIFLKDISTQRKAQEDLAKMNYRLRNLSAHIQNSREEERMNIAREIHDELGQLTTALKIDMAWVKKKLTEMDSDPKTLARVEDMLGLLHEMVTTIRRISQELRPSILDNLGLSAAVEWYLNEFEKRTNIKTSFENTLSEEDGQLPNLIKTSLFRICQESLTNVMRHAQATKVDCSLQKIHSKKIVLQIKDNGQGFNIKQKTKSFGLLGMQERAAMINGKLTIASEINSGTTIHVEVEI